MSWRRLELVDFRIFSRAAFEPAPEGTTVITGPNGTGKTSVLEAMAYLGTGRSFRGAPRDALVRSTTERAIVRAEVEHSSSPTLVEGDIVPGGRSRTQVNRKVALTRKDLAAAAPCTVFSPEDLALISGGPKGRRELLDDGLALLDHEGARAADDTERVLRQRAALLRQANGRLHGELATTLDVWDQRLATSATKLAEARERVVRDLEDEVTAAYARLAAASSRVTVSLRYDRSWEGDLAEALTRHRTEDVRRSQNTVGTHRDDLMIDLAGLEARTQASQGEQRCLALALRIGVHRLVERRTQLQPTLLLDDVFSELDPARSLALVAELPQGQSILTTAAPLPPGIAVTQVTHIEELVAGA